MARQIIRVYSGKANQCMCGCKGKWTYALNQATQSYQNENPRVVARHSNYVLNHPDVKHDGRYSMVEDNGRIVLVEYDE